MSNKAITQQGLDNIKSELEYRQGKLRVEIADNIESATEQGDFSENSAYKSALEEKELNESKIEQLLEILSTSIVIKDEKNNTKVNLGDKVSIISEKGNTSEFILVGIAESNPIESKISVESPMGKAMVNKSIGDSFTIETQSGTIKYKIKKIQ